MKPSYFNTIEHDETGTPDVISNNASGIKFKVLAMYDGGIPNDTDIEIPTGITRIYVYNFDTENELCETYSEYYHYTLICCDLEEYNESEALNSK